MFYEEEFNDFNVKIDPKKYITFFPDDGISNEFDNEVDILENGEQNVDLNDDSHKENDVNAEIENIVPPTAPVMTYEDKYLTDVQNLNQGRLRKPSTRLIESVQLITENCFLTSLITETDEPNNVEDALVDPNWKNAMKSEMSSMYENDTWELVPRPTGKNIIGSRWVFKVKRNANGSINRYKARLVAQGFTQEHGIDYNEVFSPVA